MPEWPPHPDRVFMALAAAWFETGRGKDQGLALEWLETLGSPGLCVSRACVRKAVTTYVPVNDGKPSDRKVYQLPVKQWRKYSVAIPENQTVHFVWDTKLNSDANEALQRLCENVTRVGSSASFVQMWVNLNPPLLNLFHHLTW